MEEKTTRRTFLATAGAAAAGVAFAGPALRVLASAGAESPTSGSVRYALVVDLAKCRKAEGCRDCRIACDREHNVPHVPVPREEVKWIWKEPFEAAFPTLEHDLLDEKIRDLPLPVLCNHCDSPPCVRVCPTQATFRRDDGIVMMDEHRCIGCRYCMVACPYGSRSFNFRDPWPDRSKVPNPDYPTRMRGVVEKCTLCDDRIAVGEKPVCVEACKEGALVFGDVKDPDSEIRKILGSRLTLRRKPELGTFPHVYYVM